VPSDPKIKAPLPDAVEIDAYKVLRTQIRQRTQAKGWNTLMVTRAGPGEGKTLTAINLAITLAKGFNQTVLLVDSDLRRPTVGRYMCLDEDKGRINYLLDDVPLKDLIIWPCIEKLTIIPGGHPIEDSAELLGSDRMTDLVAELKNRYADRFIIFDAPPILSGADVIAFAPIVDGILFVVESGKTSIKDVIKAVELVPFDKLLGFVLNRHKVKQNYYRKYNTN
jgi:non-specific protein-tyrosine kinase